MAIEPQALLHFLHRTAHRTTSDASAAIAARLGPPHTRRRSSDVGKLPLECFEAVGHGSEFEAPFTVSATWAKWLHVAA
jgi:hypothetical protein